VVVRHVSFQGYSKKWTNPFAGPVGRE
jgi:hypothetical protein